jgi:hypothetical protein
VEDLPEVPTVKAKIKAYLSLSRLFVPEAPRCRVTGCKQPARKGRTGLCGRHYQRLYHHGDPARVPESRNAWI